jgi:DNA helicase-2/ATP-dependent DNA helicase PcrA
MPIPTPPEATPTPSAAALAPTIPQEEEAVLRRVLEHLGSRRLPARRTEAYDAELVALRDEIAEARLEDVPALLAQMERLAGISAQRADLQVALVDPRSPYFARLRLRETDPRRTREREVLVGRSTYIDRASGVCIVDWRHAPVSQLYYRYAEGDGYEEKFGDRTVDGEVLVRRTLTIDDAELLRVACARGTFVRGEDGGFRWIEAREAKLAGGQGTASRPTGMRGPRALGVGADGQRRVDRHLPEISALLDPRQFELIARPDAGPVVIQGGAGSGKTTIGLHRIAFLSYQAPKRFAPERMLVVTPTDGLVAYTSELLPSLGVEGVAVVTFARWAAKQRATHMPWLGAVTVSDETPAAVSQLKKHPAVLGLLEARCARARADARSRSDPQTPVTVWAETLTDLGALREALARSKAPGLGEADLRRAHRWCAERCAAVAELRPGEVESGGDARGRANEHARARVHEREDENGHGHGPGHGHGHGHGIGIGHGEGEAPDDDDVRGERGIDGLPTSDDLAVLDREDEALLLRAYQCARGPLRRGRERLEVEHLFVDEAQDASVAELAVLLDLTTERRSVTLAGDAAQRLELDNGFRGWPSLFQDLGVRGIEVEPLRLAYRSTREVLELARELLGPLAQALPAHAPRAGAPVEMFSVPNAGVAVALLGEALRTLAAREPRATVAVLARHAEQADVYHEGLRRAEVPNLRRVRAYDFTFRPGVDVTEMRQVKGLEYDYVVLVEVNAASFPPDDESRHLMHVGATRAAHQLWLVSSGRASPILPAWLVEAAL